MTRLIIAFAIVLPLMLPLKAQALTQTEVSGGGGLPLAVFETGNPEGPEILFVHGFTSNHLTWMEQLSSDLADEFRLVAVDLRGHGASGKPLNPELYADPALWAADIDAVIRAMELDRPVIVAWSMAGALIADYLKDFGDNRVGGIVFNGAFVSAQAAGGSVFPDDAVAVLRGMAAPDMRARIESTRTFVSYLSGNRLDCAQREFLLGSSMMVPLEVRAGVLSRQPRGIEDAMSALDLPVLALHGTDDRIVKVLASEYIVELMPGADMVLYEEVGHSPHQEAPDRFNRDLRSFVRQVSGD